ncbi:MAG: hypothetical protein ACMXYL_03360 [Candidatus Woesearchaeota archaeon]
MRKGIFILAIIALLLSYYFFIAAPLIGSIGYYNDDYMLYSWCEIPRGLMQESETCTSPISIINIFLGAIIVILLSLLGMRMVYGNEKDDTKILIVVVWIIGLFSLPILRNLFSSIMHSVQALYIIIVLYFLFNTKRLSHSFIVALLSLVISIVMFGLLYTLLLLPFIIALLLKRVLWHNDKHWYRTVVFSIPIIALIVSSLLLLISNMALSSYNTIIANIFLLSGTLGYPLSFIGAIVLCLIIIFIRIRQDYILLILLVVSSSYYVLLGPLSASFHTIIFSVALLYIMRWIVSNEWSYNVTRNYLMAIIMGSIIVFGIMIVMQDDAHARGTIPDIEGRIAVIGPHSAYYACLYDTYPPIGYSRNEIMDNYYRHLYDNNPRRLHSLLLSENIDYLVIDRNYLIGLLERDDTGLLFVLRVHDGYERIYPEGGDLRLEYYRIV